MTNEKLRKQLVLAGWNAGWAAACLSLADNAEKQGASELAAELRRQALLPAPILLAETRPGETHEQAMKRVQNEKGGDA